MVMVLRPAACSLDAASAADRFCTDGVAFPPELCRKRLTGEPSAMDWFAAGTSHPSPSVIVFGSAPDGCTGPTERPAPLSAFWASPSGLPHTFGTGTCFAPTPTTTATAFPGVSLNPGPGFWLTILPISSLAATILVAAGLFVRSRPSFSSRPCTADALLPVRFGTVIVGGLWSSLYPATPSASAATIAIGTHHANQGRWRNTAWRLIRI